MRPTLFLDLGDVVMLGLLALVLLGLLCVYAYTAAQALWESLRGWAQGQRRHWRDEGNPGPWDGKPSWRDPDPKNPKE